MDIRNIKQLSGQSVCDFHSQMSIIWDQLALMEPKWTVDATLYEQYREETRLVQFLVALCDDFEGVRSSMLYHIPLPIVEFGSCQTDCRGNSFTEHVVFATPSWKSEKSSQIQCNYCKKFGHMAKDCPQPLPITCEPNITERVIQSKILLPVHLNSCKWKISRAYSANYLLARIKSPTPLFHNLLLFSLLMTFRVSFGRLSPTLVQLSLPILLSQDCLTGKEIGRGRKDGRLYQLEELHIQLSLIVMLLSLPPPQSLLLFPRISV